MEFPPQMCENHVNSPKFPKSPPQIIENQALLKHHVPEYFSKNCISTKILP